MKTCTTIIKIIIGGLFLTTVVSPAGIYAQSAHSQKTQEFALTKATNLGEPINTSELEFAPTISPDGKTMIFQSNREGGGFDDVKLYISHKTESGWTEPVSLDKVNSITWDGGPFLTYDQNFLIISSRRSGGQGDVDLWISHRLGDDWARPVNMGPPINTPAYEGFGSLANDDKTLYFMRDTADLRDCGFDICVSVKQGEVWSEPVNLPYPINTAYCEAHPIILPDGKTLIFSSKRPGGFGDYDLYKSERQEDDSWSEPINLGSFINTPADDRVVSIPASGDILYFASGDLDKTDLYSVPIPPDVQPTLVITVSGTVKDASNPDKPLHAEITILDMESAQDTTFVESNQRDGSYIVILNKGKIYDVSVSSPGYTFYSTKFDLTHLEAYDEVTRDILLEPLKTGVKFVLNNIYFELDSYDLLGDSKYELDRVMKLLTENPNMQVEISAHTDSTASEQYNLTLSMNRAQSVIDYLTARGVEKSRLIARGFGEKFPIASNATEDGRQMNRRVEFKIISTEATVAK